MVQNWTEEPFELSNEGETDLQNMENNFKTLKSLFSGASYGLNTEAGTPWYDSGTPILGEGLLKIRKQGDDGWLGVLALGQESDNGLVWFHGDNMSNQEGWVIDTKIIEDRVMALKNHGSGSYTTGRQVVGSWNISGLSDSGHTHPVSSHTHPMGSTIYPNQTNRRITDNPEGGTSDNVVLFDQFWDRWIFNLNAYGGTSFSSGNSIYRMNESLNTDATAPTATNSNAVIVSSGAWRIKGQVGIVIYPDI